MHAVAVNRATSCEEDRVMRSLNSFSELEILVLAITLEEEDERVYADYHERGHRLTVQRVLGRGAGSCRRARTEVSDGARVRSHRSGNIRVRPNSLSALPRHT